jgi:predicted nucleic acid-binding protein
MKVKMSDKLFFDTCALIEISKGNLRFERYKKSFMILTDLNLMEYAYYLLKIGKENQIKEIFEELGSFVVDYTDEILVEAAKMKFEYKKEKLSFVDCIGYLLAKKHEARFLTSDGKFESKDNVEYVK